MVSLWHFSRRIASRKTNCSLPTGFGESLCFAMIPKVVDRLKAFFEMVSLRPSIFLVVSPIVRLMQDQVGRFCAMGIRSVAIKKSPYPLEDLAPFHTSTSLVIITRYCVTITHARSKKCANKINQTHFSRQNKMAAGSGSGNETNVHSTLNT